jgi:drug/metabolite transporter (DMT)-like permease
MPHLWFYSALIASILWGFSYALSEKVMKDSFHPIFIMVITGFFYFLLSLAIAYSTNNLKPGFATLSENKWAFINLIILAASFVGGAFLIYYSISLKNATLVNLIEISYPVFTLIFAYFLMKEVQINVSTFIGGALIFTGIGIIYLKA